MLWGSVWVQPVGDGPTLGLDHIVFNAREARGNQSDNGHFFAKSSGSPTFDHRVDIFAVQTTGTTGCDLEIPLGDPEGSHGLCALAMGFYDGPIEGALWLATLVCKDNPDGADTVSTRVMGFDDADPPQFFMEEYWFEVVGGNFHILVGD